MLGKVARHSGIQKRIFQAEAVASASALRWKHARSIGRTLRGPTWHGSVAKSEVLRSRDAGWGSG